MDKPMSIAINELKLKIINDINEAALPPYAIEFLFKDLYNQIAETAKLQLAKDYEEYQKSLSQKS